MGRREKLLLGLDVARQSGIEIGALDHPIVLKSEGDIRYVDYADAAFLRQKYRDDAGVRHGSIVEIDAIWGDRTMSESLGATHALDYALASHVVEHVPDLVAWLAELHTVLRPGASLRLAIPDLRYTFDYQRQPSSVADVLTANVMAARAPLPGQLIDSILHHQVVDRAGLWRGAPPDVPRYPPRDRLAHALACARLVLATGEYIDVHCWAFTPLSFLRLMEQLSALGFVRFACERCFETEQGDDEFIVILRTHQDEVDCVESWRRAADALRPDTPPPPDALARAAGLMEDHARRQSAEIARLLDGFTALERRAAPLAWVARRVLARVRAALGSKRT